MIVLNSMEIAYLANVINRVQIAPDAPIWLFEARQTLHAKVGAFGAGLARSNAMADAQQGRNRP
jgi:hypothetical protein